jgi:hypothetical protein
MLRAYSAEFRARAIAVVRAGCSWSLWLERGEVGWVALGTEPDVEGGGDDVAVRYAMVSVEAADTPLELEDVGDGVVELSAIGVAVGDDRKGVGMRSERIGSGFGLGFECVGHVS